MRTAALPTPIKAKPYAHTRMSLERPRRIEPVSVPAPKAPPAPAARSAKKAPHEYPAYEAPGDKCYAASPHLNPAELHKILEVAPFVRIDFPDERKLQNFRRNLYGVNVQNKFKYATRREGWSSLIILRLK